MALGHQKSEVDRGTRTSHHLAQEPLVLICSIAVFTIVSTRTGELGMGWTVPALIEGVTLPCIIQDFEETTKLAWLTRLYE